MSVPSIMMLPRSGLSSPISALRNTDLPVPEGPSMTETSPAGMVRVTSPQISCLPKDFVRSVTSICVPIPTLVPLPSLLPCLARRTRLPAVNNDYSRVKLRGPALTHPRHPVIRCTPVPVRHPRATCRRCDPPHVPDMQTTAAPHLRDGRRRRVQREVT